MSHLIVILRWDSKVRTNLIVRYLINSQNDSFTRFIISKTDHCIFSVCIHHHVTSIK